MLKNFRTLAQAKKDRDILQEYVNLIEHYQPKTFEQYVVFEYALQGSIEKTALNLNQRGNFFEIKPITADIVKQALTSTPNKGDDLHKWIRSLYLKRTRPNRRKQSLTRY
ncbi:hypothetical protein ACFSCZ_19860 [Siminovitchia sediminis]|uniref:Uncharacterized protein n=1 Tax=Siminovitchia sediminis TaxID=1274353 RepID=A0ABW4KNY8_9BACI